MAGDEATSTTVGREFGENQGHELSYWSSSNIEELLASLHMALFSLHFLGCRDIPWDATP